MATYYKPRLIYKVIFFIARIFKYEVSVSKNPPFMKHDNVTVVYIRKVQK